MCHRAHTTRTEGLHKPRISPGRVKQQHARISKDSMSRESHEQNSEYSPRCILGTVFCPTRRPSRCDVPSPSYFYPDFYPHCVVTSLEKGILRYFFSPNGYFSLTKSKEFSFKPVEFCVFYFFHTFCSFMGAKGVFCPPQISLL
jgi:hypothetical protein